MTGSQVRVLFAAPAFSKNSSISRRPRSRMRLRDLSHIRNRLPRIVSASTSRGDTNMRKFILIAGFVLVSAAAQAGDRSLSLGGGETTTATAPAKATDASKSAEAPAAEAPKYVERPAVVEPKAETQAKARDEQGRDGHAQDGQGGQDAAVRYSPRERRTRKPGGPESCDDVEECGGAPHALRDPGAHHHGTASAWHLLVGPKPPTQ